ncbi:hypothetical protein D9M68_845630 [compost metagenome]
MARQRPADPARQPAESERTQRADSRNRGQGTQPIPATLAGYTGGQAIGRSNPSLDEPERNPGTFPDCVQAAGVATALKCRFNARFVGGALAAMLSAPSRSIAAKAPPTSPTFNRHFNARLVGGFGAGLQLPTNHPHRHKSHPLPGMTQINVAALETRTIVLI